MQVNYAILGLLSSKPMSGYDIKKIMSSSQFMHWSGNNNQIYKALNELLYEGYATSEVVHDDKLPTKKIYTITKSGLAELKRQTMKLPEVPYIKKTFLTQLAWSSQLSKVELLSLIDSYKGEVQGAFFTGLKKGEEKITEPPNTDREKIVCEAIYENVMGEYEFEMDWISRTREKISMLADDTQEDKKIIMKREKKEMKFTVVTRNEKRYILLDAVPDVINEERDALDIVSACTEGDTNLVLIPSECLSEDFFDLSTQVAGFVLQKLANYRVKTAVVMDVDSAKGRFKEFLLETNKGNMFRGYDNFTDAEEWLLR